MTAETTQALTIAPPNFKTAAFTVRGIVPYVQHKFSAKAMEQIRATQEAGSTAKKGKKREPKDFQECFKQAQHIAKEGWNGIPAPAFRNAMISACRMCGFQMTKGKLSLFVEADGFDATEGTPLVKFTKGKPEQHMAYVRNETGVVDLRARPMWSEGWEAVVRVRFDADQFTIKDIANLLMRAGLQVGIGEGRPDSKKSTGQGWGLFDLIAK